MEAGLRPDGRWCKAFALSGGDAQKAHAIYVDLLAKQLAQEAGVAPPLIEGIEATTAVVSSAGKSLFSFVSKAVIIVIACGVALIVLSVLSNVVGEASTGAGRFFLAVLALAVLAYIFLWKKE